MLNFHLRRILFEYILKMKHALKVIKNIDQYNEYCTIHEQLTIEDDKSNCDKLELLEVLIDDYDRRNKQHRRITPVQLLKDLIEKGWSTRKEFAKEVEISPQLISDILNERRRISESTAVKLSSFFAMKTSAFLMPFKHKIGNYDKSNLFSNPTDQKHLSVKD